TGYSSSTSETYVIGCAVDAPLDASDCGHGSTSTTQPVAHAERMFIRSSGHRSNILGDYDRFGCGSGSASDGTTYFACLFSKGGASSTPTDYVLPRVTNETGKGATYGYGFTRRFYATLSDSGGLRVGSV